MMPKLLNLMIIVSYSLDLNNILLSLCTTFNPQVTIDIIYHLHIIINTHSFANIMSICKYTICQRIKNQN